MASEKSVVNTAQRAYYGCIVTLVDVETGAVEDRHLAGYQHDTSKGSRGNRVRTGRSRLGVEELLHQLCAALPPTMRVRTISTPQSIYQDLQGRRPPPRSREGTPVASPEAALLGRLGLLRFWEGYRPEDEARREGRRRASRKYKLNGKAPS